MHHPQAKSVLSTEHALCINLTAGCEGLCSPIFPEYSRQAMHSLHTVQTYKDGWTVESSSSTSTHPVLKNQGNPVVSKLPADCQVSTCRIETNLSESAREILKHLS